MDRDQHTRGDEFIDRNEQPSDQSAQSQSSGTSVAGSNMDSDMSATSGGMGSGARGNMSGGIGANRSSDVGGDSQAASGTVLDSDMSGAALNTDTSTPSNGDTAEHNS